eukprot:1019563-Amphidinium_carterae.1
MSSPCAKDRRLSCLRNAGKGQRDYSDTAATVISIVPIGTGIVGVDSALRCAYDKCNDVAG